MWLCVRISDGATANSCQSVDSQQSSDSHDISSLESRWTHIVSIVTGMFTRVILLHRLLGSNCFRFRKVFIITIIQYVNDFQQQAHSNHTDKRCQVSHFWLETPIFRRPLRPPVWQDLYLFFSLFTYGTSSLTSLALFTYFYLRDGCDIVLTHKGWPGWVQVDNDVWLCVDVYRTLVSYKPDISSLISGDELELAKVCSFG